MSTSAAKATRAQTTADPTTQQATRPAAALLPDQRPEAVAQRKLQEDIRTSPRAQQMAAAAPAQRKANQTGLPDQLKAGVENLSGYAMDDVQVHYNSDKPQQLQAHAYAQGTDIHVAPGQEQHLPHEAWHVAQQKQGRVRPTLQRKAGVPINDDAGLEKEADVLGSRALTTRAATTQLKVRALTTAAPAQLVTDLGKRSVLDTRMNDLKREATTVLSKMMVMGTDWEMQYGQKGKEKGSSVLSGKKTDYKVEFRRRVLKEYWKSLSTEDQIRMTGQGLGLLGKGIGLLARGGKAALGLLSGSGEKEQREEPTPQREEEEPSESWLSNLSQEEVEAIYEAYSTMNKAFDEYAKAKAAVQQKAGEIGEAAGAEIGRWRNEADFSKRMGALRQEFMTIRAKYGLLCDAIEENEDGPRYASETEALDTGLMNTMVGPGMVYSGATLTPEDRKGHPEVCLIAIEGIQASGHVGAVEALGSGLAAVGSGMAAVGRKGKAKLASVFGISISSSSSDEEGRALATAQGALVGNLTEVVNASWSNFTKWRSTPTAVTAIKKVLPKRGTNVAKLNAAVELAQAARGEKSDNRKAETQIFYDAMARLDVTNVHSLQVTQSIIAQIGAKLG